MKTLQPGISHPSSGVVSEALEWRASAVAMKSSAASCGASRSARFRRFSADTRKSRIASGSKSSSAEALPDTSKLASSVASSAALVERLRGHAARSGWASSCWMSRALPSAMPQRGPPTSFSPRTKQRSAPARNASAADVSPSRPSMETGVKLPDPRSISRGNWWRRATDPRVAQSGKL